MAMSTAPAAVETAAVTLVPGVRIGDEVLHRVHRGLSADADDDRMDGDAGHRRDVLERVERHLLQVRHDEVMARSLPEIDRVARPAWSG